MPKFSAKTLATLSLFIALEAVIARFGTIRPSESLKLSMDFIPIAAAAMLFGPGPAVIVSVLADVLGAFLFPVGPYFPGFTVTAALTGLLYGLLLDRTPAMPRVVLAVALKQGILSLVLNTFWLHILYGMPYVPTLVGRLPQCGIMLAVEIILIPVIARAVRAAERQVGI
jgi:ECF transporter S component (folate family)